MQPISLYFKGNYGLPLSVSGITPLAKEMADHDRKRKAAAVIRRRAELWFNYEEMGIIQRNFQGERIMRRPGNKQAEAHDHDDVDCPHQSKICFPCAAKAA